MTILMPAQSFPDQRRSCLYGSTTLRRVPVSPPEPEKERILRKSRLCIEILVIEPDYESFSLETKPIIK